MPRLEEYQRKRDFSKTPEPAGGPRAGGGGTFVVHKHAARRLHYDLRLEIGGAYASWAVPKGPSLDPTEKHLAVRVEDHPLEYGSFEGTIPEGEYGAGTVMIWDRGRFEPVGDAAAGVDKGHLKFALAGDKLKGLFALVRMKPRDGEDKENWLLMKERDDEARPHESFDVLSESPDSAASGRTMDEIGRSSERWTSEGPSTAAETPQGTEPLPTDVPLQLATLVDRAPEGPDWIHETKFDGYRLRVAVQEGRATVTTRSGADWTERFPGIAVAAAALPGRSFLLDGEAVVMDARGISDFGGLQRALSSGRHADVRFAVFDLLHMNGYDLRAQPLLARKSLLGSLMERVGDDGVLFYTGHRRGDGPIVHERACERGLEGTVSKRGDRPWVPGRSMDWRKIKCLARQEFVVGGWTDPGGAREAFGSLLLGVHEDDGSLAFAGRVGTGFDARTLASLGARLETMSSEASPFAATPRIKGAHWVRPEMVVEVAFREWTSEGILRQPAFLGVREDTDARSVRRESAVATEEDDRPADGHSAAAGLEPRPSAAEGEMRVAGVRITNPGKRLGPAGVTKEALARYYEKVAPHILPYVSGRPLTLVRCPRSPGTAADCFYQKHPEGPGWPAALKTVRIRDKEGPADYVWTDDITGLLSLVQLGVLEIHVWNSLVEDPERPDRLIFDLDPGPGIGPDEVVQGAFTIRDALGALGLPSFAKTTGGKGLHVVCPIEPRYGYDDVRALAKAFVDVVAARQPAEFTARMAKTARPGRLFVDYLRNAHGATAVCAYSTRARPGAPVSVPVTWKELEDGLDPSAFDMGAVIERLRRATGDPWAGYEKARRPLEPPLFTALGLAVPEG